MRNLPRHLRRLRLHLIKLLQARGPALAPPLPRAAAAAASTAAARAEFKPPPPDETTNEQHRSGACCGNRNSRVKHLLPAPRL